MYLEPASFITCPNASHRSRKDRKLLGQPLCSVIFSVVTSKMAIDIVPTRFKVQKSDLLNGKLNNQHHNVLSHRHGSWEQHTHARRYSMSPCKPRWLWCICIYFSVVHFVWSKDKVIIIRIAATFFPDLCSVMLQQTSSFLAASSAFHDSVLMLPLSPQFSYSPLRKVGREYRASFVSRSGITHLSPEIRSWQCQRFQRDSTAGKESELTY